MNAENDNEKPLAGGPAMSLPERNRRIIRTSVTGIAVNVMLAVLKAFIGILTHSIATTLDAVNIITDAGSSVITIGGNFPGGKEAGQKHPFGHGRIEYLSAMMLGAIVMSAGISSLLEAVRKIVRPETPQYTPVSLIVIGICVLVKISLGKYTSAAGRACSSETLINAGADASMDALISATTIIAALIFITTDISLEAWLGAVISVLIIKTGLEMVLNTLSELLGERTDAEFARRIRETVEAFPEVHGVYDLMFHDYGPGRKAASLHIEVDDMMRAFEVSDLIRRIGVEVYEKHNVFLTAISIYSVNTQDKRAEVLRKEITDMAMSYDHVLQVHGLYLRDNVIRFDVIVDFETEDPAGLCREIAGRIEEVHPELTARVFWDADYSFSE